MSFFQGLHLYEIVLLAMGLVLFLILLVLLVILVAQKRSFAKLLPFFAMTVVMVGYPSIQNFKLSQDGLEIDKYSAELQKDPTNQSARTALSSAVNRVAGRNWSDPATLTKIARAQLMLGSEAAAKANVSKALSADPHFGAAVALNTRIEIEQQLPALAAKVEQNPSDTQAKAQLQQNVAEILKAGPANPNTLTSVAQAQAALGDRSSALANADRAVQINPQQKQAVDLKNHLQMMVHPPQ
jgi:tetratricopeptide (TPR) repeat protein